MDVVDEWKRFSSVVSGSTRMVAVRLGEHVISTNPDCLKDPKLPIPCALSPQDFTPQQVIIHKDFSRRIRLSDDIALIRLDRKATLGGPVQPLCLPPVGVDIPTFLDGRDAIVAGWGITESGKSSDILKAAKIPFVEHSVCTRTYPGQLVQEQFSLVLPQVCFGGRGKVDSCRMDSGGPIFQVSNEPPRFVLVESSGRVPYAIRSVEVVVAVVVGVVVRAVMVEVECTNLSGYLSAVAARQKKKHHSTAQHSKRPPPHLPQHR
ncbi:Serine protease easter [Portunus trituberculatus]|uniref:Serine protease easter n=1 Tax=Portunus trituberculatus TaxID=210409 RepID=A0A5B7DD02_PORTR|nr:Serine protease easter [Portunus trituberculatus]